MNLFEQLRAWIALVVLSVVSLAAATAEVVIEEQVVFESHGAELAGSIVFPEGNEVLAAVVFVHGSGKQPRSLELARLFAGEGVAALVYDKRGVGESGGEFEGKQPVSEKNLALLTADAVAAVIALSEHPRLQGVPLGLTGISQAGWIVPPAALDLPQLDFLVLWSGPVCKVSEEDIFSKYTADLDATRAPSFDEALNARSRPYVWPAFLGEDTDPSESLSRLKIPGLWIFGAQDGSVPTDLSIRRLEQLMDQGNDYDYILFSGLGHNNIGGSFTSVIDWIRSTVD
ncbi:MAG: alpha/beta hydrolase [Pseudomonadota bacterium]